MSTPSTHKRIVTWNMMQSIEAVNEESPMALTATPEMKELSLTAVGLLGKSHEEENGRTENGGNHPV